MSIKRLARLETDIQLVIFDIQKKGAKLPYKINVAARLVH